MSLYLKVQFLIISLEFRKFKQFWNIKNDFSSPVIKMHMNIHVHGKSHNTVTRTQVTETLFLKGTRIKDGIFQFSANIQGF